MNFLLKEQAYNVFRRSLIIDKYFYYFCEISTNQLLKLHR